MHPDLEPPMRLALDLAWRSFAAGSFGIGAVATDAAGHVVASGRNRILEADTGDDVLAGSSLAHAEMNVLAKLRYREHHDAGLVLWTTLQPCVQCLGAIRLSSVEHVRVLAPDPLFRGVEGIRDVVAYLGRRWPAIDERVVDEWAVFSLLLPTHVAATRGGHLPEWLERVPGLCGFADELASTGELAGLAHDRDLHVAAEVLWSRLGTHVAELRELAGADHHNSPAMPGSPSNG